MCWILVQIVRRSGLVSIEDLACKLVSRVCVLSNLVSLLGQGVGLQQVMDTLVRTFGG